jgi:hypothetical protein
MAAMRSATEANTPWRMALSVISRNQRSTKLSQDDEVGEKCAWIASVSNRSKARRPKFYRSASPSEPVSPLKECARAGPMATGTQGRVEHAGLHTIVSYPGRVDVVPSTSPDRNDDGTHVVNDAVNNDRQASWDVLGNQFYCATFEITGQWLAEHGKARIARRVLEQAVALAGDAMGSVDGKVRLMVYTADVIREDGDASASKALYAQALADSMSAQADPTKVAPIANNLAMSSMEAGDLTGAYYAASIGLAAFEMSSDAQVVELGFARAMANLASLKRYLSVVLRQQVGTIQEIVNEALGAWSPRGTTP